VPVNTPNQELSPFVYEVPITSPPTIPTTESFPLEATALPGACPGDSSAEPLTFNDVIEIQPVTVVLDILITDSGRVATLTNVPAVPLGYDRTYTLGTSQGSIQLVIEGNQVSGSVPVPTGSVTVNPGSITLEVTPTIENPCD